MRLSGGSPSGPRFREAAACLAALFLVPVRSILLSQASRVDGWDPVGCSNIFLYCQIINITRRKRQSKGSQHDKMPAPSSLAFNGLKHSFWSYNCSHSHSIHSLAKTDSYPCPTYPDVASPLLRAPFSQASRQRQSLLVERQGLARELPRYQHCSSLWPIGPGPGQQWACSAS